MAAKYGMMKYELYTLVDITSTGVYHGEGNLKKYQQQNFNTVIQTIGLCGNIYFDSPPRIIPTDKFGKNVKECWYFEWTMEIPDVFLRDENPIALLPEVFKFVPYIPNLTEKSYFPMAIFVPGENILFDYKKPWNG